MKKLMIIIIFIFELILSGCSVKDYGESIEVFEDEGYLVSTLTDLNLFGIDDIDWVFVEDSDRYIASIFYCDTKETALELYEIIQNMYLDVMYIADTYGFVNSYKLYYNLIDTPETNMLEIEKIDYDLLHSVNYPFGAKEYLFGSLERAYVFPIMPLPESYTEFKLRQNYYTPQCFIKDNNVYFGSKKLLDLIV